MPPRWLPRSWWRHLPGWWWGLEGRLAGWRHRRFVRKLAAGDPVKALLTELAIEADARGIETLTARQQLVVRAWNARGVVDNGGFRFYLECKLPLGPARAAFEALGFPAVAAACERVGAAVAARPEATEQARREAAMAALGPDAFRDEDGVMFDLAWDVLRDAIGAYMRAHPRDFPALAAGAPRRSTA